MLQSIRLDVEFDVARWNRGTVEADVDVEIDASLDSRSKLQGSPPKLEKITLMAQESQTNVEKVTLKVSENQHLLEKVT